MTQEDNQINETQVYFGADARKRLYVGIKIAADAVGTTMGPRGKTVLIQRKDSAPILTKDGVTVSKAVKPVDPVEKMGAELILEAATRTNDVAGDGTTTSTVLTYSLVTEGMKLLEAGYSSKKLVEGIELAAATVTKSLVEMSKKIETREQIEHVGTISANGDTNIGKIIADAMEKVGADGIITVEDAKGMTTSLDHVEGLQFDRGYVSPYFATNTDRMNTVYSDARVLITDRKISLLKDLLPVLEESSRNKVPLLIVADDIEGEALQGLILNKVKAILQVVAVKAPGYGKSREQFLTDMCVLTSTQLISPINGTSLEKVKMSDLGKAKKIVVDSKTTTIVGTGHTTGVVNEHIEKLKMQLRDVTLTVQETMILRERIAKLGSGVAIIKVGGSTELEMLERKYRIEDALHATRAAAEEGIVPGGGIALLRAVESLPTPEDHEIRAGIDVVRKACSYPLRKIVTNAGGSPDVVEKELSNLNRESPWMGYNVANNCYVNMLEKGIIDPVKVSRTALENAKSVATSFLTLDAVICEHKNESSKS
jgi:chaperonin GroEL